MCFPHSKVPERHTEQCHTLPAPPSLCGNQLGLLTYPSFVSLYNAKQNICIFLTFPSFLYKKKKSMFLNPGKCLIWQHILGFDWDLSHSLPLPLGKRKWDFRSEGGQNGKGLRGGTTDVL